MQEPRRVTIRDVARAAAVAPSTVSRALARPGRVNAATRTRIEAAARALGYAPPRSERGTRDVGAVAVVVPDVTNPFFFDVIRGAQHRLAAAGRTQLLVDTEESAATEAATLGAIASRVDGAVLAASRLSDGEIARFAGLLPVVVLNRRVPSVSSVLIDTPGGVGRALEHLVSLGHRHVLYVGGPESSWSNERRWRALVAAAARLRVRVDTAGPFAPVVDSGAAAADAAVTAGVTACIAFNDLIAIGMLRRLRERSVRVPVDMSVVGCDDIFGADFCDPPLTTMTSPIEQAGRVAVTMLLRRIGGGVPTDADADAAAVAEHPTDSVALPTHLTVRGSTGPAPGTERSPA
ncbi:LacI family DNA-binding transcriptional regulator [Curtobacterium sp. MCBD17_040]|nr:LacI family DNA-binding transcriptional regulator [Curtobacterium sp. MCBD17_040]WIB65187.1 LacI family DNA-binding transcriptional regulator [Curtobacterium sp. MCBD17_040]